MTDDKLFQPIGNTHRDRVQCTVCGRAGYKGGSWQNSCRTGHPFRCSCGRRFGNASAIAGHLRQADQSHFTTERPQPMALMD